MYEKFLKVCALKTAKKMSTRELSIPWPSPDMIRPLCYVIRKEFLSLRGVTRGSWETKKQPSTCWLPWRKVCQTDWVKYHETFRICNNLLSMADVWMATSVRPIAIFVHLETRASWNGRCLARYVVVSQEASFTLFQRQAEDQLLKILQYVC